MVAIGVMERAPLASAVMMLEVARKTSKTTQIVFVRSRFGRASNSAGEKSTSSFVILLPFRTTDACAHIMKEILLGVTRVWAEITFRKFQDLFCVWAAARKVELLNRFQDPHIN